MPSPRCVAEPPARRLRPVRRRWIAWLTGSIVLTRGFAVRAEDPAASTPEPTASPFVVVVRRPLSRETWPVWREVYLRTFLDDEEDLDQEKEFYRSISTFFGATAEESGGTLRSERLTAGLRLRLWRGIENDDRHAGGPARGFEAPGPALWQHFQEVGVSRSAICAQYV
jgi:hypothetical protein